MRGEILEIERRRRWSDQDKLLIVSSVGIDGATVTQVAQRNDVNHAAFWDGRQVQLTPAYDLDPRPRRSHEANQAMAIAGAARRSLLALAIDAAPAFHVSQVVAEEIILRQAEVIRDIYPTLAREIDLSATDDRILRQGALLQPYAFEGLAGRLAGMEPSLQ